jgi:hypothetical protein
MTVVSVRAASTPDPQAAAATPTPPLVDQRTITVTTDANAYATVPHRLGVAPTAVVVTAVAPIAGPKIAGNVDADGYTSTTFRVRVFQPGGAGFTSASVTLAYAAYADSTSQTTPPPTTPPPTTPPPTTPPPTTPPPTTPPPTTQPPASGAWTQAFGDEFSGTAVDTSRWSYRSSAEALWCNAPFGTGNPGNQQLEFDQPGNAAVSGGLLTLTARPDSIDACGRHYDWSSGLLTSAYSFQYGYIEVRAKLPAPAGFWPAFWTWQASGNSVWTETDAFEFYSDNHSNLYLTQHSGTGGGLVWHPPFDPTAGFHTYGVDIEPTGTDWYLDGVRVGHATGAPTGPTNLIVDNFVYSRIPPAPGTAAALQVDWIRVWRH